VEEKIMKIKPATLFLVMTALLMGGIVLTVGSQKPPEQTEKQQPEELFAFEEKQVQAFTVKTQLRTLKFERDKSGKWQMLEPEKVAANDASIVYLLDLLASGKSDRTFTASANDQQSFSFQQPLATIDVTLNDQKNHRLLIGGYDFNRSFLYALVDPPATLSGELKVFLASPSFENAVNRPLAEWKQPPPSPSPAASPSPSATAAPDISPSPEASPSPTVSPSPEASAEPSPAMSPTMSPAPSPSPSDSPPASPSPAESP
jgi:Domain of unknown function (DUF4340)